MAGGECQEARRLQHGLGFAARLGVLVTRETLLPALVLTLGIPYLRQVFSTRFFPHPLREAQRCALAPGPQRALRSHAVQDRCRFVGRTCGQSATRVGAPGVTGASLQVLTSGKGARSPSFADECICHFVGPPPGPRARAARGALTRPAADRHAPGRPAVRRLAGGQPRRALAGGDGARPRGGAPDDARGRQVGGPRATGARVRRLWRHRGLPREVAPPPNAPKILPLLPHPARASLWSAAASPRGAHARGGAGPARRSCTPSSSSPCGAPRSRCHPPPPTPPAPALPLIPVHLHASMPDVQRAFPLCGCARCR